MVQTASQRAVVLAREQVDVARPELVAGSRRRAVECESLRAIRSRQRAFGARDTGVQYERGCPAGGQLRARAYAAARSGLLGGWLRILLDQGPDTNRKERHGPGHRREHDAEQQRNRQRDEHSDYQPPEQKAALV